MKAALMLLTGSLVAFAACPPVGAGEMVSVYGGPVGSPPPPPVAVNVALHVFTASTSDRPGCVDENLQPLMEPIKSGDYGRVQVNAYGFDTSGNRGVTFGLQNVQLLERGESLSGREDAATAFGGF